MTRWYAAHVVMFFKFHDGRQDSFPIYENVMLFEAKEDEEALAVPASAPPPRLPQVPQD